MKNLIIVSAFILALTSCTKTKPEPVNKETFKTIAAPVKVVETANAEKV